MSIEGPEWFRRGLDLEGNVIGLQSVIIQRDQCPERTLTNQVMQHFNTVFLESFRQVHRRSLKLHRADPVILAITDVERPAVDEDAVWPREFATKRIAVRAIAALPGADHCRNHSVSQIDPSNDVVFRVGYIKCT